MAPSANTQVPITSNGSCKKRSSINPKCNPLFLQTKISLRGVLASLMPNLNQEKTLIHLGIGDPSAYPCFKQGLDVAGAVISSVTSREFDGYAPSFGIPASRRAVADYLSNGVEFGFRADDVYLTVGGSQAIYVCLTALAAKGSNILLPRPGFPPYEAICELSGIEPRFYDLVPEKNWMVDLDQVKSLADSSTVALVIINPNNPCGAVYPHGHLLEIAETAGELELTVIADEIYGHMVFGESEFVPMAAFASAAPVITIGGLSKRWLVPGWRLGWLATCDPHGILKQGQVNEAIEKLMNVTPGPASIVQASVPRFFSDCNQEFHRNVIRLLESSADTCYTKIGQIKALECSSRPQGSMFLMVKVNTHFLTGIEDDMDFARMLMKEESVLVLPGFVLGMKGWLRIFFGAPVELLEEAFDRIKSFCERHASRI